MENYIITSTIAEDFFSKKHVFQNVDDNITFETSSFYRPDMNRYDLCISSTAGCILGCTICECTYADAGYERNLSVSEIRDQIEFLLDDGKNFIDHNTMVLVVFMGNGDPFQNLSEVVEAITLVHHTYSTTITRFGVSTIGVNIESVKQIADLSLRENIEIRLQFSTVSMDDDVRKKIMPSSIPLSKATTYLDWYGAVTGTKIRYNFPLIKGINDSSKHLEKIAEFILEKPKQRIVKLSSYNEISEKIYQPCSDDVIKESAKQLRGNGVNVDIFFANRDTNLHSSCGQMRDCSIINNSIALSNEFTSSPKLVLFSQNPNKKALVQKMASRFGIDISIMEELTEAFVDHVEQEGLTYLDRALLKAKKGYELTGKPCIATDYGMEISGLNQKPGLITKHWRNSISDDELMDVTMRVVSEMSLSERKCEFVGVGVLMIDELRYFYVRECDSGTLLSSPKGPIISGHPLSSLLYLPEKEKTLAQLTLKEYTPKDRRIYNKLLNDFNNSFANRLSHACEGAASIVLPLRKEFA